MSGGGAHQPGPGHRRLDAFVGRWETEGVVRAGADSPGFRFTAKDTYEWMEGGFFLLHHIDAQMGETRLIALEIIGYNARTDTYPMRSYDSTGFTGTHSGTLRDGVWTFQGTTERFTGRFSDDGDTLSGLWERSADGTTWEAWMDVRLTRSR